LSQPVYGPLPLYASDDRSHKLAAYSVEPAGRGERGKVSQITGVVSGSRNLEIGPGDRIGHVIAHRDPQVLLDHPLFGE
jgi:hypothetical protein